MTQRTIIAFAAAAAAFTAIAAGVAPADAALPPNHQRLAEMRAVLSSPEIAETFGVRRPLERLEYVGPDLYRASGDGCSLELRIVDAPTPSGLVGPRRFTVKAGQSSC